MTAFTSAARHDLVGTPIRVTCISPGFAETEFSLVRFEASDDAASKAKSVHDNLVPMVADDIADQIIYAATRPAHVQIQDIIAWPTNQAGPTNIARVGPSLGAPRRVRASVAVFRLSLGPGRLVTTVLGLRGRRTARPSTHQRRARAAPFMTAYPVQRRASRTMCNVRAAASRRITCGD